MRAAFSPFCEFIPSWYCWASEHKNLAGSPACLFVPLLFSVSRCRSHPCFRLSHRHGVCRVTCRSPPPPQFKLALSVVEVTWWRWRQHKETGVPQSGYQAQWTPGRGNFLRISCEEKEKATADIVSCKEIPQSSNNLSDLFSGQDWSRGMMG